MNVHILHCGEREQCCCTKPLWHTVVVGVEDFTSQSMQTFNNLTARSKQAAPSETNDTLSSTSSLEILVSEEDLCDAPVSYFWKNVPEWENLKTPPQHFHADNQK